MMGLKCFLIFGCFLLVSAGEQEWKNFKMTLGTKFKASEEAHRKQLFLKADQAIKKHNNEKHSWKMKHSKFSIMTKQEKQKYYGLNLPQNALSSLKTMSNTKTLFPSSRGLSGIPSSLDYRTDPCMAPVKDQGACGSCWAFSGTNPIEFASCKKRGNELILMSEQFTRDCTYKWNASHTGCQGGFMGLTYDMLMFNATQRMAASSKYPYDSEAAPCRVTDEMKVEDTKVIDWTFVKGHTIEYTVQSMMEVLNHNVTISVCVSVPDEWGSYGSGIYTNKTDCDLPVNHAVVVVGYGTQDSIDYWIVRNSWGDGWGDNGYVKMRRGINQCRIEAVPLFPFMG